MDFCIRVVALPQPGTFPRVVVLVVVLLVAVLAVRVGVSLPGTITLVLGAGLAGAQVARAAIDTPARGKSDA